MSDDEEHRLTGKERSARVEFERRWAVGDGIVDCGGVKKGGGHCVNKAGQGTSHEGYGRCSQHGGNSVRENKIGAWMMAQRFAGELDVTPWQALLTVLRRANAKAMWYSLQLSEADETELLPGGVHHDLVREAERADLALAKYAKMALDAGVAEQLVASITGQAALLTRVINAAVMADELALTDEQVTIARALMRREILAIEASQGQVISNDS